MSTVHPQGREVRRSISQGWACEAVREGWSSQGTGRCSGDCHLPFPGPRCWLGQRPAGKLGLRPAQHPCSRCLLRPRAGHQPWACGCAPWGPTPARSWVDASSRTYTHLHRGGRAAGRGLRAQEPAAAELGSAFRCGSARAALERVSPRSCHLPGLLPARSGVAPPPLWLAFARAGARPSLLRGAASVILRGYCSPRHNGGLVLGVASWRRDWEYAAPRAHGLPSGESRGAWDSG